MTDPFTIRGDRPAARIQQALRAEAEKRKDRTVKEWIAAERDVVWRATNSEAAKVGKPGVTLADVERAERCAQGHVDYAKKWALYCEELALGRKGGMSWLM